MKDLTQLYLDKHNEVLTVKLVGIAWHCILTQLAGEPLTPVGHSVLTAGAKAMIDQLRKAIQ